MPDAPHPNTGRVFSEDSRHLMRLAKIGKKQSPEHIAARVAKLTGRKRSKRHCDNISKGKMKLDGGIAKAMYEGGATQQEIGSFFGVTGSAVGLCFRRMTLAGNGPNITPEMKQKQMSLRGRKANQSNPKKMSMKDQARLVEMRKRQVCNRRIAEELGFSESTIGAYANKLGVGVRQIGRGIIQPRPSTEKQRQAWTMGQRKRRAKERSEKEAANA